MSDSVPRPFERTGLSLKTFLLSCWIAFFWLVQASSLRAQFVVTSTEDSVPGSLRSVIAQVYPGAIITFTSGLSGKMVSVTNGEIVIDKDLTLDASTLPEGVTIDGAGKNCLFQCFGGNTNIFTALRLTGGFASGRGGAIQNNSILILDRCTLEKNSANYGGAIHHESGTLTVQNSLLTDNSAGFHGGVIYSESGSITFSNCTLAGNTAGFNGGGICNLGDVLTVRNSTIAGNAAGFNGGGVFSDTDLNSQQTILVNSTLFNNSAGTWGGAFYNHDGASEIVQCTLTKNTAPDGDGGGIASYGDDFTQTTLQNTIVAGNSTDVDLAEGNTSSFISQGNNLIGTGEAIGDFNKTGDQLNSAPGLAPPGYYGGPTPTLPPMIGSPVIDAGSDNAASTILTDQRGYSRVSGPHVDIGAAEMQFSPIENPAWLASPRMESGRTFSFGFTNVPDTDFTVLASTNATSPINEWTPVGLTRQIAPGEYRYTDFGSSNYPTRFYQLVVP